MDDLLMTAREARLYLGISTKKLAELIKDGTLPTVADLLDKRFKLIRRADVEKLKRQSLRG